MRELVIIIWAILSLVFGLILTLVLKQQKRKLGKYVTIYKLLLIVLSFLFSLPVYYWLKGTLGLVWVSRLVIFTLGVINVYALYHRPWSKRHAFEYEEDAFWVEFLFVCISGCLTSIMFVSAPQITTILPYSSNVSRYAWDFPFVFVLPFLMFKLTDFAGHKPFRVIENPWLFTVERVNPSDWKWRNLIQVNFQVKKSLKDEYNLFSWEMRPWIEVPQEVPLNVAFRLCIQERRQRKDLLGIDDMGDEYGGTPEFCWIFFLKKKWYNPVTWFRRRKCLNPNLSIEQNKIGVGDIIIGRRIPGDGQKIVHRDYQVYDADTDKTIIINR